MLAKSCPGEKSQAQEPDTCTVGRGLEWHFFDELCIDHMPVTGDGTQRSVVKIWMVHTTPVDRY